MNGLKREFKVDDTGASEATKSELGQTDSKLVSIQAPIVIPQNKSIKVPELKFVYYEKATKFCEISTLLLPTVHTDKSKVEILQTFVAFSEYINFTTPHLGFA